MRLQFYRIAAHPAGEPLDLPDGAEGIQFLHGAMDEYVEVRYYTKEVNDETQTTDNRGQHQRSRVAVAARSDAGSATVASRPRQVRRPKRARV